MPLRRYKDVNIIREVKRTKEQKVQKKKDCKLKDRIEQWRIQLKNKCLLKLTCIIYNVHEDGIVCTTLKVGSH